MTEETGTAAATAVSRETVFDSSSEGSMRVTKAMVVGAALLLASAAGASAVKIKKAELPEAVREAVDREAPGAHVVACWRNVGDREAVYEVDLKAGGRRKGLVVAVDGEVLVAQEEVTWAQLPEDVQRSFQRAAAGNDIEEVHQILHGGEVVGYGARIDGEGLRDFQYEGGPHGEPLAHDAAGRFRESWRQRAPTPSP